MLNPREYTVSFSNKAKETLSDIKKTKTKNVERTISGRPALGEIIPQGNLHLHNGMQGTRHDDCVGGYKATLC